MIVRVDAANHVLTLRDLRTKKMVTIQLAEVSSLRTLPPEMAERFPTRSKGAGRPGSAAPSAQAQHGAQGSPASPAGGERGERGADLSQLVSRLPETPQASLHKGEAVMIVGMPKGGSTDDLVAVTLLAGVEPILAANPNGEADAALSPWNLGGAPEGGS